MDVGAIWGRILELVAESPQQTAVVEMFEFKSLAAGIAKLALNPKASPLVAKAKSGWMGDLLSKAAGSPVRVELVAEPGASGGAATSNKPGAPSAGPGPTPARLSADAEAALRRQAMEQPLVKRAAELFNARIIGIEDDPGR